MYKQNVILSRCLQLDWIIHFNGQGTVKYIFEVFVLCSKWLLKRETYTYSIIIQCNHSTATEPSSWKMLQIQSVERGKMQWCKLFSLKSKFFISIFNPYNLEFFAQVSNFNLLMCPLNKNCTTWILLK